MRRRRERQQGSVAEAVQIHLAVDVRKEVDGQAGPHAVLVAEQKRVLETRQLVAIDRENDFVDHLLGEQPRQIRQRMHGIAFAQLDGRLFGLIGVGDKAAKAHAVGLGVLNQLRQPQRSHARANHDNLVRPAELTAYGAHQAG